MKTVVIAEHLKVVREKNRLSQFEMAKLLNITTGRVQQLEQGEGCRFDRVLGWQESDQPSARALARRIITSEIKSLKSSLINHDSKP